MLGTCFGFLEAEYVWLILANKFSEVFFDNGTDAVNIPGYEEHRRWRIEDGRWRIEDGG